MKTDGQEEHLVLLPIQLTWTALIITTDMTVSFTCEKIIFHVQYLDQTKYLILLGDEY